MEKAIFISKINQISKKNCDGFDRVYFGEEFCQWNITDPDNFKEAQEKTKYLGIKFTCVTPYFTENGIKKLQKILNVLSPTPCEIVINDWGSLYLIHQDFPQFIPIMGRLLTRQRRCLPITPIEKLSENEKKFISISGINTPIWGKFLKEYNVNRIEIDNLPGGISPILFFKNLKISIYYPFGYLTTTQSCFFKYNKKKWDENCRHKCLDKNFKLNYPSLKMEIYLKGNTQFFRNDTLPDNLLELGIDRIIDNSLSYSARS